MSGRMGVGLDPCGAIQTQLELADGHEFVRSVVNAFGPEIESVSFGKATLEDVFVTLTEQQEGRIGV